MNKKVILMILDGWGKSPDPKVSAIDHANTPFIDSLYTKYAHASLRTDGLHVGLPEGQMGNSEVGHMNLGAGRIVYQDLVKINLAVQNKTLGEESTLKAAFKYAKENQSKVHFLGLLSDGGVHSHIDHLFGLLDASAAYDLKKKQGFYKKNPQMETALKQMTLNSPTENSRGLRFGNFVQMRAIMYDTFEAVFSGQKTAQQGLDDAADKGNKLLRKFEKANK